MHQHAVCNLLFHWPAYLSWPIEFQPLFHLQLALGRVNTVKNLFLFLHILSRIYFLVYLPSVFIGFLVRLYMEKKKYNLRSTKSDSSEVPVQLQISNDSDFITNLLGSQTLAMAQQASQNSSSDSDLDCSALVNETDSDDASTPVRSFNRFEPEASTSSTQQNNSQDVQALVNHQILSQLSAITDTLTQLEGKQHKKTSDKQKIKGISVGGKGKNTINAHKNIENKQYSHVASSTSHSIPLSTEGLPTRQQICANAHVQQGVEDRLKELQQLNKTGTVDGKNKSQRGGSVEVFVKNKVKWPHEYVLAGNQKERVSYDQLTMGQWMDGFCRSMRDETCQNNKEAMLEYLISLLDDSNDFSWSAAKASHAVLLCRMEQEEIQNFTQVEKSTVFVERTHKDTSFNCLQ